MGLPRGCSTHSHSWLSCHDSPLPPEFPGWLEVLQDGRSAPLLLASSLFSSVLASRPHMVLRDLVVSAFWLRLSVGSSILCLFPSVQEKPSEDPVQGHRTRHRAVPDWRLSHHHRLSPAGGLHQQGGTWGPLGGRPCLRSTHGNRSWAASGFARQRKGFPS